MTKAQINGFEMNYCIRGEGPTLVMAHGLMGNIATAVAGQSDPSHLLWNDFRVINYDARGHGESGYTTNPADYHWSSLADDMHKLLLHLGVEKAHIGGGSMGAGTSIAFALDHPQMVDKLVLFMPPPIVEKDFEITRLAFGGLASLIESRGLEKAVEVALGLGLWRDISETNPERFEWLRGWLLSQNPLSLVPAIRGLLIDGPPLPQERLSEIKAPTLIIAHEGDPIHPINSATILNKAISGSRLTTAPDMFYWEQHMEEAAQIIRDFLKA